jgi:hypothetical protein
MRFLLVTVSVIFLFASASPARAQLLGLGVEGGARVSNDVFGNFGDISSESKRYIVGPRVNVHLPRNFLVEVEALYRPFGFSAHNFSPGISLTTRERANSWEFPLLLKYRYPGFVAHPFIGAGYEPRIVHGNDVVNGAFASGITSGVVTYTYVINQQSKTNYPVSNGAVVSGGLDFVAGPVHISPELRYIHWSPAFLDINRSGADGPFRINSSHNELLVLFGVTWH